MRLEAIELENFRNYKKVQVKLNSDLILILGENASGKTNFLESVYFLSRLKSFRVTDNLLVKNQEDYFKIVGRSQDRELEVVVQINPAIGRSFKIDQQKTKRTAWQSFKIVLFEPNDLNIFILGPSVRRRYLNNTITQVEKGYAADLIGLDHVLKQRSALLDQIAKNQARDSELNVWDSELAGLSLRISKARRELLVFLNQKFDQQYEDLTGFKNKFEVVYKGLEEGIDQSAVLERLVKIRATEIKSGQNLFGPHRDDFIINKDGELNLFNSSRGELREQVLTIKLLQAQYLSGKNDKPIILLDDVFSELDETRRAKLLENLSHHQVFITSTEEHHLPRLVENAQVLMVTDNNIK